MSCVLPIVIDPNEPFTAFAPPKPKRMSEIRYRELYDSQSVMLELQAPRASAQRPAKMTAAGLVSAQVLARTYHRDGYTITITPALAN